METDLNALRNKAGYELVHAFLEATGLTIVEIAPPHMTTFGFQLDTFPGVLKKFKISSRHASKDFTGKSAEEKDKENILFRINLGVFEDVEREDFFYVGFDFKKDRTVISEVAYTSYRKLLRSNQNFLEQVVGHFPGHEYPFEEAVERMKNIYSNLREYPNYFHGYFYEHFPQTEKKKEYSEEY